MYKMHVCMYTIHAYMHFYCEFVAKMCVFFCKVFNGGGNIYLFNLKSQQRKRNSQANALPKEKNNKS